MIDFRSKLTVFVLTVDDGTDNYAACIAALSNQDCQFQLKVIRNVAPMNAAFQRMIDECETEFFIEVDHDMILYPDGVRRLMERMEGASDKTAIYCLPLWDVHLSRTILGCKIYRHGVVRQYPYQTSFSCEMDQANRMKKDGFEVVSVWQSFAKTPDAVGEHGKFYTAETAYVRYKRLMEKARLYPWIEWVKVLPKEFLERYRRDACELNFWSMTGAIAGLTSDAAACTSEHDYRGGEWKQEMDRIRFTLTPLLPQELIVYATDRCNLKCVWCKRQTGTIEKAGDVSAEQVSTTLLRYPTVTGVCIAGFGEPLLCYNLDAILTVTDAKKIYVGLITNGLLLPQNIELLRRHKIGYVSISLNAADAKTYQQTTSISGFETAVGGINAIKAAAFCDVCVSAVVHRENLESMGAFFDLAATHGWEKLDLLNILPHAENKADDDAFWNSVLRSDDGFSIDAIERLKVHPEAWRVRTWPTLITKDTPPPCLCRSPFVSIGVNGYGRAGGCRRVHPPATGMPHITSHDPWNSPFMHGLRKQLLGDAPLGAACRKCFGNWKEN